MSTSIDFATLKEAVKLSTLVSGTVKLKRYGRHWNGLCPFHNERTPSFYVYDDTRAFHCFGCGAHGDAIDWLVKQRGLSIQEAIAHLGGDTGAQKSYPETRARPTDNESEQKDLADAVSLYIRGIIPQNPLTIRSWPRTESERPRLPDPDTLRRLAIARRTWEQALPPNGTPVERYLQTRGVHLPDADVLRWHPCCPRGTGTMPAMVARMSDPVTDEFRGLHRTFLRPDGSGKADIPRGEQKLMLGGSGIIQLADIHDIGTGLGLAEGLETALSVMQVLRWGPVWAAGSAGNIRTFPFMPATTLNVFPDRDQAGIDAADACATRWVDAGAEVLIHTPPEGKDWNDVAKEMAA
jgi:hypothetical protein